MSSWPSSTWKLASSASRRRARNGLGWGRIKEFGFGGRCAIALFNEAVRAAPFQVTHVLTDRGSCFTAEAFEEACRTLKVQHRKTKPYTPKTNGLAERFNGRVQREVLGITVHSHADLKTLPQGFNQAHNSRRQRVLQGASPEQVVQQRLVLKPELANPRFKPPDPNALPQALQVVAAAKEDSQPDS